VHWARRILADRDALTLEVTALQTGLVGELRLGVVPNAATTVALLTDSFCAAHPLVRVRVETNLRSAGIIERIRRFELDAGILYPDRHDTDELLITPLYQEHQVLIVGSDLLAGKVDSISWSDALALPLCLLTVGMRGRRVIDDALAAAGLAVNPQLETDSVATLFAHVGTGRWASIVPQTWIRALGVPAGASVLRLRDPAITAPMVLVTNAEEPGSVVTRALVATARGIGDAFERPHQA
jgi:DNA-binding transcriptional LysR family regulator